MRLTTKEMTSISLFAALHIVAAIALRVGGEGAVPFSLVPLFVLLAGLLLGQKGALSLLLYVLFGLIGLPVFAKPPYAGLSYFLQPSFGFLLGYVFAAWLIGWLVERTRPQSTLALFLISGIGLLSLYLCGLPYLHLAMRLFVGKVLTWQQVLNFGFWPFIGWDLVKAGLAAVLAQAVRQRLVPAKR